MARKEPVEREEEGEAEPSPGVLYRHFASKEELVTVIASERHAAELAMLRASAGDGS